jgi:hypothetical protein
LAKATSNRSRVESVTLTLSRTEALALTHLLRIVRGPFSRTSVRSLLDDIRVELTTQFVGDVDISKSDSYLVIGGNCSVRTEGISQLENQLL